MSEKASPPGWLYLVGHKHKIPVSDTLAQCQQSYAEETGHAATWLRVNRDQVELFEAVWPGAVTADHRILTGAIMLGHEE